MLKGSCLCGQVRYEYDGDITEVSMCHCGQCRKAQGTAYAAHSYAGTQHGFHNNSTPRYQQAAADLSWSRTLALFQKTLKA